MEYFVFKTDIKSQHLFDKIKPILKSNPVINDWWVDTKDVDHVLRVKASEDLREQDIIMMMHQSGFQCEPLKD